MFRTSVSHCSRTVRCLGLRNQIRTPLIQRSASLGRCASTWTTEPLLTIDGRFRLASANSHRFIHLSAFLGNDVIEVEGPAYAESITEGDIRWLKQPGEFVEVDELVAEIETDKTTVEVPSPQSGTIEAHLIPDGEKVLAKAKIYTLKLGGAAPAAAAPAAKAAEPAPAPASPAATSPTPQSAPIPTTMPPVPPKPSAPISSIPVAKMKPTPAPAGAEKVITGSRTENRVKINRMRNRIAQRLKEAQNIYAMLTTFNEIDMSNIIAIRNESKDAFLKKHGIKFGFMSPFVKATAYALQDQPVVNAVIDENEIVYRNYVDISVAVATPKGLVVPVIRNVEGMNYADIERTIGELGAKAKDGKLAIEDMEGGTFTISNGGVFGSMFGTPIINPPQSAILGMHGIFERPVAIKGKVEIRPIMTVALTYDHRLIDGREAVLFLRKVKQAVENPVVMLMDL